MPALDHAHNRLLRVIPPLSALIAAVSLLCPHAALAQALRPWTPPGADTLLTWATEARVRFQANTGDSVTGRNYEAYEIVGRMGQSLLRGMGRERMIQANVVETVLDSLGLDTDVSFDPELPYFALLMVRNPFQRSAASVGYLYWYRQEELRVQGLMFAGGRDPKSKVWWTSDRSAPYAWGILDRSLGDPPTIGLTFLRLEPNGFFWNLVQFASDTLNLGGPGNAEWTDINRDGVPEAVTWIRSELDSTFVSCNGCPQLIAERTFVERKAGFQIEESRLVPTSFASLVLFVRFLQDGNRGAAERLVADPRMVDQALEWGWNRRGAGLWKYEYGEPGERWPRWMTFSHRGAAGGRTHYVIHFGHADGRWILERIEPAVVAPARGGGDQ